MLRISSLIASVAALSSSIALGAEILVTVGGTGDSLLTFNPDFVNANINDTVIFQFHQANHTVTQSTLDEPCTPLPGGFDTGFVPVAADVTADFPQAELLITDTAPIWVFCRQTGHCQKGMVFAVNPGNEFDQFKSTATGGNASTSSATSAAGVVTVTATVTVSDGSVETTTYQTTAPTTTGVATSTDHKVVVGGTAGLVYTPSNITAQPGDTVTFEFQTKNHTATQSSFADPCRKLSLTNPGTDSFDSGFMPVNASTTNFPTYTIQINDTTPVWVYCRQTGHCGSGMVFSVNAPETGNTFEAFQEKAIQLNGTGSTNSTSSTDSASGNRVGAGMLLVSLTAALGALL